MAKALTHEQTAKVVLWLTLATALLFAGPKYGERLIFASNASTTARWLGIAVTVVSMIPWFAYVAWGLSLADEYNRRMLVVGTAVAFGLSILFSIATQLMADAHLTREVVTINLPVAFLLWIGGLGVSAIAFRLRGTR